MCVSSFFFTHVHIVSISFVCLFIHFVNYSFIRSFPVSIFFFIKCISNVFCAPFACTATYPPAKGRQHQMCMVFFPLLSRSKYNHKRNCICADFYVFLLFSCNRITKNRIKLHQFSAELLFALTVVNW